MSGFRERRGQDSDNSAWARLLDLVPDDEGSKKDNKFKVMKALIVAKMIRDDSQMHSIMASETPSRIFIGSIGAAYSLNALKESNITHILTCGNDMRPRFLDSFQYLILPIKDNMTENISMFFNETCTWIDDILQNHDGNILVHCFAGKSRSTTICCSYLMTKERTPLIDALERIRKRRPVVQPNPSFIRQLKKLESDLGITSSTK